VQAESVDNEVEKTPEVEEVAAKTPEDISHEKFEKLCKWASESIPGLGKRKPRTDPDPEELVPEPCDCEHTNHGLHWKPSRRTELWAEYMEALAEVEAEPDGEEG
jgi:hypothetical protein